MAKEYRKKPVVTAEEETNKSSLDEIIQICNKLLFFVDDSIRENNQDSE